MNGTDPIKRKYILLNEENPPKEAEEEETETLYISNAILHYVASS